MSTSVRIPVELNFANITDAVDPSQMRTLCSDNPNCKGGFSAEDHIGCPTIFLIPLDDVTLHKGSISIRGFGDLKAKAAVPRRIAGVNEIFLVTDGDFSSDKENFHVEFVVGA